MNEHKSYRFQHLDLCFEHDWSGFSFNKTRKCKTETSENSFFFLIFSIRREAPKKLCDVIRFSTCHIAMFCIGG